MHGISRTRHVHLVDALLQLENIFAGIERKLVDSGLQTGGRPLKVIPTSAELKAKRLELENSHEIYLDMLGTLAFHIAAYEDLFADIKVHYVGNRLKELKKHVQPNSIAAEKLRAGISLAYGT